MKPSATIALAFALALAAVSSWGASLPPASHAYGFDGDLTDELGGPAMESIHGTIHPSRLSFRQGGGALVDGAVSAETYSIEMRVNLSLTGSSSGYYRLLDFKDRASDNGLYEYFGTLVFYGGGEGTAQLFMPDTWTDVVLTRDGASARVVGYVNGEKQFTFTDTAGNAVFTLPDGKHTRAIFFQDDLSYPDEDCAGFVDHIRVFDTVLTDAQAVALAHGRLPPNVNLR
jgi:hypothetical protein